MPFLEDARQVVNELQPGTIDRLILEFLLQNGIGRNNAQPWSDIDAHLQANGINVKKQTFQLGFLKQSREGTIYIGSNNSGYFLIESLEDANAARDWYIDRINVEQERLQHLEHLIEIQNWEII